MIVCVAIKTPGSPTRLVVLVAPGAQARDETALRTIGGGRDKDHRLSPVELLLLFQLVGTWWKKGELPFPSMSTLAVRCGVSERQIQRAVNHLEKVG